MKTLRIAAVLLLLVAASACSGPTDPSSNTSQSFSGSVQPFGQGPVHTFSVQNTGEITVVVNTISPGNTYLGVAYGQVAGSNCATLQQNAVASTNLGHTALSGSIIVKGTYCVFAFDPINLIGIPLTIPQNYTLTVSHP